jgi:hypothetical protein
MKRPARLRTSLTHVVNGLLRLERGMSFDLEMDGSGECGGIIRRHYERDITDWLRYCGWTRDSVSREVVRRTNSKTAYRWLDLPFTARRHRFGH